ncbi:MAG: iron-sulfur cluster assembly accessory protein [Rickettsia endosymbiont of Bryobia graminum]|nr:iron-sulfur cluster assembly accessory protein [Rickettsia endosymbiont of Bryobia graminum]
MSIKVTDSAFKRVVELIILEKNLDLVLRISVDGGGCSGFTYSYLLVNSSEITENDAIFKKDDSTIIIDDISQNFMTDCIIDYIEELGSSYFEIRNPNAKAKCGCGNSFSL